MQITLMLEVGTQQELENIYRTLQEMGLSRVIVHGNGVWIMFDSLVTLARFAAVLGGKG